MRGQILYCTKVLAGFPFYYGRPGSTGCLLSHAGSKTVGEVYCPYKVYNLKSPATRQKRCVRALIRALALSWFEISTTQARKQAFAESSRVQSVYPFPWPALSSHSVSEQAAALCCKICKVRIMKPNGFSSLSTSAK